MCFHAASADFKMAFNTPAHYKNIFSCIDSWLGQILNEVSNKMMPI